MKEAILGVLGEWVSRALYEETTALVAGEYSPSRPYRADYARSTGKMR